MALHLADQADRQATFIGSLFEGKYHVVSELGQGSMGAVYLARQAEIDRRVALKILRPTALTSREVVQRFIREAIAASQLTHPNSIVVFDSGQAADGTIYIVMEYLEGRTLGRLIADDAPMPAARAVHIVAQICDSLAEAHDKGIVHRDLKPANIIVCDKPGRPDFVKVLDFGVAKYKRQRVGDSEITVAGEIIGTPAYMSPEQAVGEAVDGRSDLYAVGAILFELLTGEPVYGSRTPLKMMMAHVHEPVPELPEAIRARTPLALVELLGELLSKAPDARPEDAVEVSQRLRLSLSSRPAGRSRGGRTHTPRRLVAGEQLIASSDHEIWTGHRANGAVTVERPFDVPRETDAGASRGEHDGERACGHSEASLQRCRPMSGRYRRGGVYMPALVRWIGAHHVGFVVPDLAGAPPLQAGIALDVACHPRAETLTRLTGRVESLRRDPHGDGVAVLLALRGEIPEAYRRCLADLHAS